ncbi:hypothetical protein DMUE_0646 [Dictyocoela muelleri]|nr:hypothetical protein DMUE_0646 [Dictyocoela muelleri]
MKELTTEFIIRYARVRVRCPWIQGQVERLNQTLKLLISSSLISLNFGSCWSKIVEKFTFIYNSVMHSATRSTPMKLMFGEDIHDIISNIYNNEELNALNQEINMNEEGDDEYKSVIEGVYNVWNISDV